MSCPTRGWPLPPAKAVSSRPEGLAVTGDAGTLGRNDRRSAHGHHGPAVGLVIGQSTDIAADREHAIVVTGDLTGHAQGRGDDVAISADDMGTAQRRRDNEVVVPALVDVGAEVGGCTVGAGIGAGISSESDVALAGAVGVGP